MSTSTLRRIVAASALACTLPLLTACVSPSEQRVADAERCRSYGFRPGTDAFAGCLQNVDLDRSADRRELLYGPGGYGGIGFGRARYWR